jgi:predicted RNA-binding Zn-ribbon protein involved in translation (DUF1610 family)
MRNPDLDKKIPIDKNIGELMIDLTTEYISKAKAKFCGEDVIESTTGYSCPNCGAICSDKTLISRTDSKFEEDPNPHYSWDETHKCQKCETLYLLHNGT